MVFEVKGNCEQFLTSATKQLIFNKTMYNEGRRMHSEVNNMATKAVQKHDNPFVVILKALFVFLVAFAAVWSIGLIVPALLTAIINLFYGDFQSVLNGILAFAISFAVIWISLKLFNKQNA